MERPQETTTGQLEIEPINSETHISPDYINEIIALNTLIVFFEDFADIPEYQGKNKQTLISEILQKNPIKHYDVRYDPTKFANVITPENKERVTKINDLADKMNLTYSQPNFEMSDFLEDYNTMTQLINGQNQPIMNEDGSMNRPNEETG